MNNGLDNVKFNYFSHHYSITQREMDVLILLIKGGGDKLIAKKLGLSPRTINKHLEHIYKKLKVKNRTEAVILVIKHTMSM